MRFKLLKTSPHYDLWGVLDTQENALVIVDEGYQIASQIEDSLNGRPGAVGECREVAASIMASL